MHGRAARRSRYFGGDQVHANGLLPATSNAAVLNVRYLHRLSVFESMEAASIRELIRLTALSGLTPFKPRRNLESRSNNFFVSAVISGKSARSSAFDWAGKLVENFSAG